MDVRRDVPTYIRAVWFIHKQTSEEKPDSTVADILFYKIPFHRSNHIFANILCY